MVAIVNKAPAGVAGSVSRSAHALIENYPIDATVTTFGMPVKVVAGKAVALASGDAATVIAGLLVRSAPQMDSAISGSVFGPGVPDASRIHGLMVEGYAHVVCAIGTPLKGAPVYVRVTAASGKNIGDIEATADGSNNVVWPGVKWACAGVDANKVGEIAIY